MRFASVLALIASVAGQALQHAGGTALDVSARPRNPSPAGKRGHTVAVDRRRAKKAKNVARNRAAHR